MKSSIHRTTKMQTGKIFLLGFFITIGIGINLQAQNLTSTQKKAYKDNFKEGTLLMSGDNFGRADERLSDTTLQYFLRCYAIDSNANVSYIIGKLYVATAMHKAAGLPYLVKAVKDITKKYYADDPSEKHAPPMAYYWLARAQLVNYQFDNAIANLTTFKKMLKPGDARPKDVAYWLGCCNSGKDLMQNQVDCRVVSLGDGVNSTFDDYSPVITADESQLYFTSKRPITGDTSHNRESIWMSSSMMNKWGTPQNEPSLLSAMGGNSATVSLSPDGQAMVVYQSSSVDNGMIYVSKLNGMNWSRPTLIDTGAGTGVIDSKGSKYFTPSACMSPDGKTLYFSSDRPGGTGGLDLYRSDMGTDGSWGPAVNLGASINTKYNEDCPFVSFDGSLLFFSSEGHNSMGGYDVFMCKAGQGGDWGDAQNLGYPINTPDDDKYFVLSADGKRGYYNTVRLGSMGERDLYKVTFTTPLPVQCVDVFVAYVKTSDGSPLPSDARVACTTGGVTTTSDVNSKTGKILSVLKTNQPYTIVVIANGKQTNSYTYTPPKDSGYCTISRSFYNGPIVLGDPRDIFNVPKPAPPTPVVAASKFSAEPYFVKYFGYNLDAVTDKDPDFNTLVSNITNAAKDTKIIVTIESSASTVPTTKFGNNENLAKARAEALKKTISSKIKDMGNISFELKPSVNGPEFNNDAQDHAKYEKFQNVKAYIRENNAKPL